METMTPVRRGRCAGCGSWQEQYRALQMTGEEAAALIRNGDVMVFTPLTNWPREVDAALAARLKAEGGHVEIYSHFAPLNTRLLAPGLCGTCILLFQLLWCGASPGSSGKRPFCPHPPGPDACLAGFQGTPGHGTHLHAAG